MLVGLTNHNKAMVTQLPYLSEHNARYRAVSLSSRYLGKLLTGRT